jgi:hypothetical protein
LRMILSENRFPSSIGVEDMLFGIMRYIASTCTTPGTALMEPAICGETL